MIDENKYPVLSKVDSPADLKEMEVIGRTVTDPMDDNPVMWD